jgi:hypothetical protein
MANKPLREPFEEAAAEDLVIPTSPALVTPGRRLADMHEDVPTNVSAKSSEIEAEWSHDYNILKPILRKRGYEVDSARHLCGLPQVYCASGYRRRLPFYTSRLMGDWVGSEYVLMLRVANSSLPATIDQTLFDLKRVGYLEVLVTSGAMPSGVERLPRLSAVGFEGTNQLGLEGALPEGFWNFKARMFWLSNMPASFAGRLEDELPCCQHLDYRVYIGAMPSFAGNIQGLATCTNGLDGIWVWDTPRLQGNAWATILAWGRPLVTAVEFYGANFTGLLTWTQGQILYFSFSVP